MSKFLKDVKLKDIESGVPITAYCGFIDGRYDIITDTVGFHTVQMTPMEIQFTIHYEKIHKIESGQNGHLDDCCSIQKWHAVFTFNGESIEIDWDLEDIALGFVGSYNAENVFRMDSIQLMQSAKHLLPSHSDPRSTIGIDTNTSLYFVASNLWSIARLMHSALSGDAQWLLRCYGGAPESALVYLNEYQVLKAIIQSNNNVAVNMLNGVIHKLPPEDETGVIVSIVKCIHDCGKPELFKLIPMEYRVILVKHFNKCEKHAVVAELNHYTDGRYQDFSDKSKWEL